MNQTAAVRSPKFSVLPLLCLLPTLLAATPSISGISNAASGAITISPGCLVSLYGTDLATATSANTAANLPFQLGGTTLTVNGIAAPLSYVSPTQVNAQVPFEITATTTPGTATFVLTSSDGSATFADKYLYPTSPGIFQNPATKQALLLSPSFQVLTTVKPGDAVVLYVSGLGQTAVPLADGQPGAGVAPFDTMPVNPTVSVGGQPATVLFAGMAPGFVGAYQVNITIPAEPKTPFVTISQGSLTSSSTGSSPLTFTPSANVTLNQPPVLNLVYPTSTSSLAFTPFPIVASLSVDLNIAPGANPFTVYALADGFPCTINVTPSSNSYTLTSNVPTSAEDAFNFAGTGWTTYSLIGLPFPGGVIPETLLDPAALSALGQIPLGNAANGVYNTYSTSGTYTGSELKLSTSFGGFFVYTSPTGAAPAPNSSLTVPLALYVDGVQQANQSVSIVY